MTKLRRGVDWSSDLKCNDERHAIRMDRAVLGRGIGRVWQIALCGTGGADSPRGAATNRTKRTVTSTTEPS